MRLESTPSDLSGTGLPRACKTRPKTRTQVRRRRILVDVEKEDGLENVMRLQLAQEECHNVLAIGVVEGGKWVELVGEC